MWIHNIKTRDIDIQQEHRRVGVMYECGVEIAAAPKENAVSVCGISKPQVGCTINLATPTNEDVMW